jgi:hypothetical protein
MFAPSNGLGDALQMAADEPDVELPASVVIHDTGLITEVGTGATIAVKNFTVQQLGVPAIRVFVARSFKIHDADLVTNGAGDNNPIAFVASGSIEIAGRFASPPHFAGPGGQSATSSCAGAGESGRGGGGGGNATAGGRGAPLAVIPAQPGAAGGGVQPDSFSPLAGGCPGGSAATNGGGGAGGAAFQFVSATSITIAQTGIVSAPGLAGSDNEGGGAGGNIVFETPLLAVDGRVAANGGSGGACGLDGNDGSSDLVAAASVGGCMSGNGVGAARSGTGGTGAIAPTDATADTGLQSGGGGGGAAGRVSIKTADGTYAHGAASIVSAKISASALTPQ